MTDLGKLLASHTAGSFDPHLAGEGGAVGVLKPPGWKESTVVLFMRIETICRIKVKEEPGLNFT